MTIDFLRQFKIGGYAIFDLSMSYLGMWLLSPVLSKLFLKIGIKIPKISFVFLTLPLGILAHILVGNFTPMTKNFLDLNSNYVLKIIVLASVWLGVKGIKFQKK